MRPKLESEKSQEPTLAQNAFIARVDDILKFGPVLLAKRFDERQSLRTPYLLHRVPASVIASNFSERAHSQIEWTDTAAGKSGVGAISLAAHVWRVSEYEAARRIYEFVRIADALGNKPSPLRPLASFEAELAA